MEMQLVKIPEFPRLGGVEAIEALYDFINELGEQRGEELTEKQTTALIKLAKALISSIEAEMMLDTLTEEIINEMRFVTRFKKTIMKRIPLFS